MCFYFHTNQSFSLETVFSLLSVPVVPLCRFKSVWFVWSLLALYSLFPEVLFLRCHWNTFTFCALPWTDQRISAALRLTWTILGKTEEPEDSQSTFLPSPTAVRVSSKDQAADNHSSVRWLSSTRRGAAWWCQLMSGNLTLEVFSVCPTAGMSNSFYTVDQILGS